MGPLYFYVFDVIMLFYISLSSWPNINTLCTVVGREGFSVFRVDDWAETSDHLCAKQRSKYVSFVLHTGTQHT
jgi:hypothetical protein